jgi:CPA2 family monovalent cation:H+ antiporter-2
LAGRSSRHRRQEGIGTVFLAEEELAKGMTRHVLERFAPGRDKPPASS